MSFRMNDLVLKIAKINTPENCDAGGWTGVDAPPPDTTPPEPENPSQISLLREQLRQSLP